MTEPARKARGRHDHLTADEIKFIRDCFVQKLRIAYVAERLNCSERNVTKYYGYFRAEGVVQKPGLTGKI